VAADASAPRKRRASAPPLKAAVVRGIDRIPRQSWNRLLRPDDSPFLEWDWLYALEHSSSACARTGWLPLHLVVVRGEGDRLAGACPLYLKTHSMGEFVFDQAWADAAGRAGLAYYPKLVVGVPFTPHTGRRFLSAPDVDPACVLELLGRALVSLCADNGLSSVHVNFCASAEADGLQRLGFLRRAGYQYHWKNDAFRCFDDYLAKLRHKRRYAIRHERAELEKQGVSIRVHRGDEVARAMFDLAFEFYADTVGKFSWERRYLTRSFFRLLHEGFGRQVRLILAYREGRPIAGTFNLEKAGVFYGRYWGCREQLKHLHFNVCYYAAIEHCIANRLARFEPGAGGEYKWLRGFDPVLTDSAHYLADPALRRAVERLVDRERVEVEAYLQAARAESQLKPGGAVRAERP
jgi:predicted N-acyltransferase